MKNTTKLLLIIIPLIAVIAVVGSLIIAGGSGGPKAPIKAPGTTTFTPRPAPDFTLTLFSGKAIKLSDFKGKQPVVINFWASWCPPCRDEAPVLAKISKNFGEVKFIGITINDTKRDSEAFMKEFNIDYDNGPDTSNIRDDYGLTGVPETFWIDTEGNIVDHWIGAIGERDLVSRTERLLQ